MYPFMIDVKAKKIVVIGGGKIATKRVLSLLDYEADIKVVSPKITEELQVLAEQGTIRYRQRTFRSTDVRDAFIVIAATNDATINHIIKDSCSLNQLINIVDDPEGSSFHFPAMHAQNGITVAVNTSGASPILASRLRNEFAEKIDNLDAAYIAFLREVRERLKQTSLDTEQRKILLQQSLDEQFELHPDKREQFLNTFATVENK